MVRLRLVLTMLFPLEGNDTQMDADVYLRIRDPDDSQTFSNSSVNTFSVEIRQGLALYELTGNSFCHFVIL